MSELFRGALEALREDATPDDVGAALDQHLRSYDFDREAARCLFRELGSSTPAPLLVSLWACLQQRGLAGLGVAKAAIAASRRCSDWGAALEIFDGMLASRVAADCSMFSATMTACEKGSAWANALGLLDKMVSARVELNLITYNVAVSACVKGAKWVQALRLLGEMTASRVDVNGGLLGSTINTCRTASSWGQACLLLERERWRLLDGAAPSMPALDSPRTLWRRGANLFPLVLLQRPGILAVLKPANTISERLIEQVGTALSKVGVTCVSRLDEKASGVLMIALGSPGSPASNYVMAQFAGRLAMKTYQCLCSGEMPGALGNKAVLSARLSVEQVNAAVPSQRSQVRVSHAGGQEACTSLVVKAFYHLREDDGTPGGSFTYLEVRPITGRTHQIRVHLASIGKPVVCDYNYNRDEHDSDSVWCPRLFLHCSRVALHDADGKFCSAKAPLSVDLIIALTRLETYHR